VVEQVPLELQVEREVEVLREFRIKLWMSEKCGNDIVLADAPPHHRGPIGSTRTSRERGSCNAKGVLAMAHNICHVPRNGACWHITHVM